MADSTISDLTELTTPALEDLIAIVDDPSGSPVTKQTSLENVINLSHKSMYDNAIINGNFDVSQRATTFVSGANNDDVYTLDRWNLISDGNDVFDISQEAVTDLPGSTYAIKLDVETAKRGGIAQFIEFKDAIKFKGQTVSLSFKVKSANIAALRATVLSWGSTADSVTSDVVGTWADTPTWAANWTDNATPADLTVTSDWTTVKVEGIVLDEATVNNLALVIWTPNEETIGDIVYISQVKLELGDTATTYQPRSYGEELALCQRYYQTIKGTVSNAYVAIGAANATDECTFAIPLPVTMRTAPTVTITGTVDTDYDAFTLQNSTVSATGYSSYGRSASTPSFRLDDSTSGFTAGTLYWLVLQTTTGSLNFSAEL